MLAQVHCVEGEEVSPVEGAAATPREPAPVRHAYVPPAGRRRIAFMGTALVYAVVVAGFLVSFERSPPTSKPAAPLSVTLLPLASPPETPVRPKVAPRPVEKHEQRPTPPRVDPMQPAIVPTTAIPAPPPEPAVKLPEPAPRQPDSAAPRTVAAPLAPQAASNAPDSWEGRVLARLERFRQYPGAARSARQQGVAYIRFRIGRDGHLLSSSLLRSSGFAALDQAALDTLRRADPLPRIPADRADEIELSVPIEFYLR